jgi:hypothetical protein
MYVLRSGIRVRKDFGARCFFGLDFEDVVVRLRSLRWEVEVEEEVEEEEEEEKGLVVEEERR